MRYVTNRATMLPIKWRSSTVAKFSERFRSVRAFLYVRSLVMVSKASATQYSGAKWNLLAAQCFRIAGASKYS